MSTNLTLQALLGYVTYSCHILLPHMSHTIATVASSMWQYGLDLRAGGERMFPEGTVNTRMYILTTRFKLYRTVGSLWTLHPLKMAHFQICAGVKSLRLGTTSREPVEPYPFHVFTTNLHAAKHILSQATLRGSLKCSDSIQRGTACKARG